MPRRLSVVLGLLLGLLLSPSLTLGQDDPLQASTKTVNVELILDASGSMAETLPDGESRMAAAKRILRGVIESLPERAGVNVGLRVYGHLGDNTPAGKPVSCRASELLVPVAGLDKASLIAQVEAIQPTGWTPIAYSLQQAAADFQPGGESITNAIVLVTDGEETCDPPQLSCDAASALRQAGIAVTTHVVGFALTAEQTEQVRCIAEQGGGQLFGAENAEELSTALGEALEGVGVRITPVAIPPVAIPPVAPAGPLTEIRTLAYHQLTGWSTPLFERGIEVGSETAPILSDDGQRIAFGNHPGELAADPRNRIFVIHADGTGEREVDAYPFLCFCASMLDLSADGSRIVSSDAVQLRVADGNGGGGRELLALASNEINGVRISGDGSRIVFRIYRDTSIRDTSPAQPIARGIYSINTDGSGLRQIVGPSQMAALLGIPVEQAPFFGGSWGLDISRDGSRVVFTSYAEIDATTGNAHEALFAVGGDGAGLRRLLGPTVTYVVNGAISGDGQTVAYVTGSAADGRQEAGVIGFDGSGQRPLTDNSTGYPGLGGLFSLPSAERIQLSGDGTRLLFGSTGLLYDTTSGDRLSLGVGTAAVSGDPTPLVGDGLSRPTMNAQATRFAYVFQTAGEPYQLARLDLNPGDLEGAPGVTEARVSPAFVLTETRSTAMVSARVSPLNDFVRVGSRVLFRGLPDPNVDTWFYGPMVDDGASLGDAAAGDGVFTYDEVATNCCAELGPRLVRVKAETQAADGLRHATAVDVTPFAVVATSEAIATSLPSPPTVVPPTATVPPPTPTTLPPTLAPPTVPPPTVPPPTVPPPTVLPQVCGPVEFPLGDISFADAVVAYEPVITPDNLPVENVRDPQQALGAPNYVAGSNFAGQAVTLGNGGRLTLQFLDNTITGDGTATPDLWIAEVGIEVEDTVVEVSVDRSSWVPLGTISGGTCGVDLDAFGFGPADRFTFVRLTDDPNTGDSPDSSGNDSPGADIDAVGAISTAPVVTQPVTPAPVTPLVTPPGDDAAAQATIAAQATRIAELEAVTGLTPTPSPAVPPTIPPTIPLPQGTETAPATPRAMDFLTPDPAECSIAPRTADELAAIATTPDEAAVDALAATRLDPALTIPEGAPADAATTAAVEQTYRLMVACFNAGNDLAAYALWTDDALRQIAAQPPTGEPTPLAEAEREAFRVTEVRLLPDGRVVAVWEERNPLFATTLVQILERQGDSYAVADTVDVAATPPAATPPVATAPAPTPPAPLTPEPSPSPTAPPPTATVTSPAAATTDTSTGAGIPPAADFLTPDPAECTITPRTADELAALAATSDQAAVDALEAAMIDETITIPEGAPADAATIAAVVETYRLMIACFNAGNDLAAYALWTDDALRRVAAQPPTGEPTPLAEAEREAFRVTEVRLLPDGRVVAVMEGRSPLFTTTLVQILERQDDGYVVADTVDIVFA